MSTLIPSISRCCEQSQDSRIDPADDTRPSPTPPIPQTRTKGHQLVLRITRNQTVPTALTPSPREARSEQKKEAAPTGASPKLRRPSLQEPGDSKMNLKHCAPLWAHQAQALDFIADKPGAMLAMEMGTGKDLDNETLIPTPTGWTRMGDMQTGDTVFDEQGQPCSVTAVFPQGDQPVFEITFDDGTTIVAGAEHQWIALTRSDRHKIHHRLRSLDNWSSKLTPRTTEDIKRSLLHRRGALTETMHSIPTAKALHLPAKELSIDPYILGISLGDGTPADPHITCHKDSELLYQPQAVAVGENWDKGRPKMTARPPTVEVLKNKHIPSEYLRASAGQRLRLLQGLMDSNGHANTQGEAEFISTCRVLAEATLELALSLGQKATMQEGTSALNGTPISAKYYVPFTPTLNVFTIPRKADPLDVFLSKRDDTPLPTIHQRYITDVKNAGTRATTCITVNSPSSMFLAGRQMVPTHNTAVAIEHIHRIGAKRTLAFAPLSIVDHVWADQVKTHSRKPLKVASLGQKYKHTKEKIQAAEVALASTSRDNPLLIIVNYESVTQQAFRNWVVAQNWDLLIMDESHRLKGHDGKISMFIAQLSYQTPRRLALTGIPMPHSPMDIWAQYRALNVTIFGSSFHRFRDHYAELEPIAQPKNATDKQKKAKQITSFRNEPELRDRFRSIAFEVKSEDVLNLPPQTKTNLRVVLNPKARQVYDRLENALVATLESGQTITAANALSKLLRLQQVTSGFAVSNTGETARIDDGKAQALEELMEAIDKDEPIVVFARFLHDIRAIKDRANRLERPAWEHSGERKELDQWLKHGGIIAVQIQAGGTGLDLTFARYCIYYSLGFSLGDYQQSMARLHRPGQQRPVYYIHLLTENSVDEKVISALNKKDNVIRSILSTKSLRKGTEEG